MLESNEQILLYSIWSLIFIAAVYLIAIIFKLFKKKANK